MNDFKKKVGKEIFKGSFKRNETFKDKDSLIEALQDKDVDFDIVVFDSGKTENEYFFETIRIYAKEKV